ncbi:MAG TPA: PDZ domain-containing protein [Vicinamibacteria bacterium]
MRTELPLVALLAFLSGATPAVARPAEDSLARNLSALESRYRESLVSVRYRQRVSRSTSEPAEEEELVTTGIIVSPRGVVLTSAIIFEPFNQVPHGVGIRFPASVSRAEAEIASARIRTVGGSEYPAMFLGRDSGADVAFFQIDAEKGKEFTPVVFAESRSVSVGEEVAVVGLLPEPIGPAVSVELSRVQAVTEKPRAGFVVGTGASDPVGALVCSLEGEVLGYLDALTVAVPEASSRNPLAIVTMMRDLPKGIGRAFARPAKELVDASVETPAATSPRRGWLGVEMQAVSKELASYMKLPTSSGILIGYVYRNSPAERAGLAVGDVLVGLEGQPVDVERDEEIGSFAEKILRAGADAELSLEYLRAGARKETKVRLEGAPRSVREALTLKVDELDLVVREITYDYVATRFLEPDQQGVVIVEPPVGVSSNQNRIVPGDLLVRVGEEPVADFAAFRDLMGRIREKKPEEVVLFVERGRESFFFAVKPDWN